MCSRDHGPHEIRRHGLALRAGDAVQCNAKVFGEFGSVIAEFEWPVCPLRPCNRHFGAAALGDATDVIALPNSLLGAVYVQRIESISVIRVIAGVASFRSNCCSLGLHQSRAGNRSRVHDTMIAHQITSVQLLGRCVCYSPYPKALSKRRLLFHAHFALGAASGLVYCNFLYVLYVLLMEPSNVSSKPSLLPRQSKQDSPKPTVRRKQVLVACSIC